MYNIERYLKTLELDKILQMLSNEASIKDSRERALTLIPDTDFERVSKLLNETFSAYQFSSMYQTPSFSGAKNVLSVLNRADAGAVLSMRDLLDTAETLRVIRVVKSWRENCTGLQNTPLEDLFNSLIPNKYLEDKINFAIKNEEELNDNASPTLYDIRRKISAKSSKIRELLDKIVKGPTAKYLQDNIVTQRDGRFVVPLKAEHKGQIGGIVHTTSATGSTLFI